MNKTASSAKRFGVRYATPNPGTWLLGHGSFNPQTDQAAPRYTIPDYVGSLCFWCRHGETLKASIAEIIRESRTLIDIPDTIRRVGARRYPNRNFDELPRVYGSGQRIPMYRLTNADDVAATAVIGGHANMVTVPPANGAHWPQRSRTIAELIEGNREKIIENGGIVHWLACRSIRNDR